jgi:prepilin-type processing-associated H-X9-DG protein
MTFYSYPANWHNGGGNVTFADTHVESHRWKDSRTKLPMGKVPSTAVSAGAPSPGNVDLIWLNERATSLK